mgnify:CR=1 FL=1
MIKVIWRPCDPTELICPWHTNRQSFNSGRKLEFTPLASSIVIIVLLGAVSWQPQHSPITHLPMGFRDTIIFGAQELQDLARSFMVLGLMSVGYDMKDE